MKRFISLVIGLFFSIGMVVFGQLEQPVTWTFNINHIGEGEAEVVAEASIETGWHLYSAFLPANGPVPTSIVLEQSSAYTPSGKVVEYPKPEAHYDSAFDMELGYFSNQAKLVQKVVLNEENVGAIKGYVEFMACNDEQCLPPESIDFELSLTLSGSGKSEEKVLNGSSDNDDSSEQSYWTIFFVAFFSGFAALLTPCVFPMIPMTVSFFTKQSKSRAKGISNAILYGGFIIFIYVVLGSLVTYLFGADSLNALATSPWFNAFFFVLLVVFAMSFLGAFEIVLPSKWVNAADSKVDKGGFVGIFFMALTLALVSFSCTGPIVGPLLVQAALEGGIAPMVGMLGFSTALALPFAFFAAFPGYLNSLPKSGGWLNSVKVVLGFLELAFAFKFLSMADLVLDLHLLEREVYIAIWIVIFGALGFYLLGKIKLPHDSPLDHLPVSRLLLGLLVLSFTIYMIPGMWGAPLKLISAFPPPMEYAESPEGVGYKSSHPIKVVGKAAHKDVDDLEEKMKVGPQGINVFEDYEVALKYARKTNKPLFLDFTGKACVNCRQMEINVWSNPEVNALMRNEYVVVALYVDSRKELSEEEKYVSPVTGKKIRTVGNKWSDFQISRYKRNGQPHYVLLDHNEEELVASKAYEPNVKKFKDWLQHGLEVFKE